jgi:hypothetical protein
MQGEIVRLAQAASNVGSAFLCMKISPIILRLFVLVLLDLVWIEVYRDSDSAKYGLGMIRQG